MHIHHMHKQEEGVTFCFEEGLLMVERSNFHEGDIIKWSCFNLGPQRWSDCPIGRARNSSYLPCSYTATIPWSLLLPTANKLSSYWMQKRNHSTELPLRCCQLSKARFLVFGFQPSHAPDACKWAELFHLSNTFSSHTSVVISSLQLDGCRVVKWVSHRCFPLACRSSDTTETKPGRWQNSCLWSRDLLTLWMS